MKKGLLQKVSDLCCFALDDKECIKFLRFLIIGDNTSARLYLEKCIENIEFTFAFDSEDESLKKQLLDSNSLMDLVMELSVVNETRKRKKTKRPRTAVR